MTTAISAFLPWVLPAVPGCPDILALKTLRDTLTDFTQRTDLIQRVIAADATINVQDYLITPPTDMQLARVLSVGFQGTSLSLVSPDVVNSDLVLRGVPIGAAVPCTGVPVWAFQKTPYDSGFSLYPIPNTTVTLGLTVKASFQVTNTATTCDDPLFTDWADDIAAGALARLMMMPGQPFSSQAGKSYATQYSEAVSRGKRKKLTGEQTSNVRVMAARFI